MKLKTPNQHQLLKDNFYRLLLKYLLPLWLLWTGCWHIVFHHLIDYRHTSISSFIVAKWSAEAVFFVSATLLLFRRMQGTSLIKVSVLLASASFALLSLWAVFTAIY